MHYEQIYFILYKFANYEVHNMLLCRWIALFIPVPFLLLSRVTSSPALKLVSIPISLLFYSLPWVVGLFAGALVP